MDTQRYDIYLDQIISAEDVPRCCLTDFIIPELVMLNNTFCLKLKYQSKNLNTKNGLDLRS